MQLLVYIRIAEFVCTLINIPLKCFDVLISWFLGNPSTKVASLVEEVLLFIFLFLLVGIDPGFPAQSQCALSSINSCGLKDLEREKKSYTGLMNVHLWSFPFLNSFRILEGRVVKCLVRLGEKRYKDIQ